MKKSKADGRALLSVMLAVVVASVFSLSSFAASKPAETPANGEASAEAAEPAGADLLQAPAGVLTASGLVTINGNPAKTGSTVVSGSVVTTGPAGLASIDLGYLGRIGLRSSSSVLIVLTSGMVHIKTACSDVRITVTRGQLAVKSPETRVIGVGEKERMRGPVEGTTNGDTDFVIDCSVEVRDSGGGYTPPPVGGVISMVAIAGGITAGILAGANGSGSALPRASVVVP